MGGVLIEDRNFWMTLHEKYGTLEEGRRLTDMYLMTDYAKLVDEVPNRLWLKKDSTRFHDLVKSTKLTENIDVLLRYMRNNEIITAIISASELDIARRIQKRYGIDHIYANHLVTDDPWVTGEFWWPVGASGMNKLKIMESLAHSLCIPMGQVIYVGNDDIDRECLSVAGLPIAFNAKPSLNMLVAEREGHVQEEPDLERLIGPIMQREL
jgi:phosphoserine phosphatase